MAFHYCVATDVDPSPGRMILKLAERYLVFPEADSKKVWETLREYMIEKNGLDDRFLPQRFPKIDHDGYHWDIFCRGENGLMEEDRVYLERLKDKDAAMHEWQTGLNGYKSRMRFAKNGDLLMAAEDVKRTEFMDGFFEFFFKKGVCVAEHLECTYPKETQEILDRMRQFEAESEE